MAELFREIDLLRQAKRYGGREDGEASKEAFGILRRIKDVGGI
ncbi:MAG: hypothetical protein QMD78_07625 [Methanocellales archaeon]|nr:hypothetical protein [Methanocellales archaeon]